jgi:hypothetical protein
VAGKRSDQAKCASGRALRNLQQVLIDLGRISPAIQPAGNLIDEPLGAIGVEPLLEIPAALAWVYVKAAGNALRPGMTALQRIR